MSEAGMAGDGGSAGAESVGTPCEGVTPLFDFEDSKFVVNGSTGPRGQWSRGPYGSTNTLTGDTPDKHINPPQNPYNLSNLSRLEVSASKGEPAPAMSFAIPISPTVYSQQVVNVLYVFAAHGSLPDAVDFSRGKLSARVKLDSAPHPNCTMVLLPWTTGTTDGTDYNGVDGGEFPVSAGKWTAVTMDLSTSTPKTSVNQYGFVLTTTCKRVIDDPPSEGGAGGAGDGGSGGADSGGSGGSGGSAGAGYAGPKTVVLFDNIKTTCD
jgi:hypothetical protein